MLPAGELTTLALGAQHMYHSYGDERLEGLEKRHVKIAIGSQCLLTIIP